MLVASKNSCSVCEGSGQCKQQRILLNKYIQEHCVPRSQKKQTNCNAPELRGISLPKDLETPFVSGGWLKDRGVSTLVFSRDTENAHTAKTTSAKARKASTLGGQTGLPWGILLPRGTLRPRAETNNSSPLVAVWDIPLHRSCMYQL